jgi:hypothetical protein
MKLFSTIRPKYGTVRRCYDNTSDGKNRSSKWFQATGSFIHKPSHAPLARPLS